MEKFKFWKSAGHSVCVKGSGGHLDICWSLDSWCCHLLDKYAGGWYINHTNTADKLYQEDILGYWFCCKVILHQWLVRASFWLEHCYSDKICYYAAVISCGIFMAWRKGKWVPCVIFAGFYIHARSSIYLLKV